MRGYVSSSDNKNHKDTWTLSVVQNAKLRLVARMLFGAHLPSGFQPVEANFSVSARAIKDQDIRGHQ